MKTPPQKPSPAELETARLGGLASDVLERLTDAFVALDRDWRYTYVNAKAGELLRRRPAGLLGKNIWTEFPEAAGMPFQHAYRRALAEQVFVAIEEYFPVHDRWFENRIHPGPDGLLVFFHDITGRKHAEALVAGQSRIMELIVRGEPLTGVLDALLRFIESQVPEMLCSVLLLDADGVHVRHGASPSLPEAFTRGIDGQPIGERAGSCGTAAFRREPVFVEDIANDPLWVDYRDFALQHGLRACWSTPIFDANRRVLGTFAIYYRRPCRPTGRHQQLIDVTTHVAAVAISHAQNIAERQQLAEQVRQTQKMEAIGTLAGGIAHDFNNVLAAIKGYAALAKKEAAGNASVTEHLDEILSGCNRAIDLVKQILAFSRRQELERKPIALRGAVEEALRLLRATLPATVEIEASFESNAPNVLADATQVHQIVMNLCTNAAHAMKDRPGRLTVKLENSDVDSALARTLPGLRPGPFVLLSVSDTGHGMDQATRDRIFEPFFTTKPPGEGTGLGLSVVYGIMQSHEGAVTVASRPGEGTAFLLYFPAHAD